MRISICRIRFLLEQPETVSLGDRLPPTEGEWPDKNASVARRNREDGNAAFQAGDFGLALMLYSEAARYAPVDPVI